MRSLTVSYLTAFVLVAVCGNVGAIAPGQPGAPAVPGAPSAHGVLPHHHHDHLVNLEFSPEVEFPDVNIANADQKQNQHGRRGQTSGPRTPRRRHQILGSKFNVGPDVPAPDLEGANGLPSQEHSRRGLTHVTGHHAHGDVVHGDVVGKVKDTANVNAANAEQSQNQRREYDLLGAAIRGDLKHAANSKRDHDHDHDAVILADILALIKESGNVNMANAQQSQNQHGRRNGASSHSHGHDVAHADVVAIVKDTANVNMANAHQTQDQHAKRCHDEAAILAEIVALIKGSGNVNIANADQSQNQHAKRCHDEAVILAEIVALIKGSGNVNIANAEQSQNQHAKRCHDDALILAEIVALIKGSGNINLANAQQSQNQHAKRCLDDAVILAEIVALIKGSGNFNIANAQQSQNQHGRRDVAHADIVAAIEDLLNLNIANAKQTQNQAKRFLDPAALDFLSKPSGLSSKRGVDANGVDNTHTATSVPGLLFEATVKIGPLCDKLRTFFYLFFVTVLPGFFLMLAW